MRTLATVLSLLIVFLAGCASDPVSHDDCEVHEHDGVTETHGTCPDESPDGGEDVDEEPDAGGDGEANATVNTAPIASINPDVTMGEAPLRVLFTVNVTDAEGDNVTWTLDADGDGSADGDGQGNGTLEFIFEADGVFLARANATDGTNWTVASIEITVLVPTPEGPCGGAPEPCKIGEDAWAEFWSDGVCEAKGEQGNNALGWMHDRPGSSVPVVGGNPAGGDWPYGTGYISGGGTWFYQESNSKSGLQLGGTNWQGGSTLGGEVAAYKNCANHDLLIF